MTAEPLDTRHILTCQWCGHAFTAKRITAKTCSDKCRKRISRWRQYLTRDYAAALAAIDHMADYLKYKDFTPIVSKGFLQIKHRIDDLLAENKVKAVSR